MAIIIDTNCLANVFSKSSSRHKDFAPVLDWILSGKGLLIYGGTKYKKELRKASKYIKIITELKNVGKAIEGNTENIDKIQEKISSIIKDHDFDDPHLPAIVIDTKCQLICTEDTRSIKYVQNSKLYPKGIAIPKYYTGNRKNCSLLCDDYIDESLKPLRKINKECKKKLKMFLPKK